jgi:3-oxoacyl-[acyl-carrier-protein] synthase II
MTGHVISAWSAVSPYGIGAKLFADGVALGPASPTRLDPAAGALPGELAYLVPHFDIRTVLGRKGTRSMDQTSALVVTAARELLDSTGQPRTGDDGDGVGLVLGTTAGSAQSVTDLTRDMLVNEKPFYVDPSRIPNGIMNGAAAQCAIWHRLRGPNVTIGGGRVAGLFALRYAMRLLGAGRAEAMLCGGVEEFSPARAWLEHHGRHPGEPDAVLGEGAGLLLLEPPGRGHAPVLAELLAVELAVYQDRDPAAALERCVRRGLDGAGVTVDQVWTVAAATGTGALAEAESAALGRVFGESRPQAVPNGQPWGDAGAATVPFLVAAVLSAAEHSRRAAGRVAVVTAMDRDGVTGAAVLRTGGMEA